MLKKNIIIGLLASFVPMVLLSNAFNKKGTHIIGKHNMFGNFIYLPIMFAVINIIMLPILSYFNIKNYFLIGAILSVIYSSIGRFTGIPQQVFNTDPNMFQFNAVALWALYYGIVIRWLIK